MFKSISDLTEEDLKGKKVLLRVDFNAFASNDDIAEAHRIGIVKKTIEYLKSRGAITALAGHITSISGFGPIVFQIEKILGININFISDCVGDVVEFNLKKSTAGDVFLLENLRSHKDEEDNNLEFAKLLAKPFDVYVSEAFSVSHRSHASIVSVPKLIPGFIGFGFEKEIADLNKIIETPKKGKTFIIGGAKIETKFPALRDLLDKSETILVGGKMANVFLKARGQDVGQSEIDDDLVFSAGELMKNNSGIIVPEDFSVHGGQIFDIGSKTVEKFSSIIKNSKIIIWNGPLGKIEIPEFSEGSKKIAKAIVGSKVFSVVGGGDTVAFLEKEKFLSEFDIVSVGGGAMLQFLAGRELPGLKVLNHE